MEASRGCDARRLSGVRESPDDDSQVVQKELDHKAGDVARSLKR